MALPEARILKPRDAGIKVENDWPEFFLSDVEIHDAKAGDGEPISLLQADTNKPLTLTGRLAPLEKHQTHRLLQAVPRNARIEVANITHYSYGEYDDGSHAIWALGRSGWFEIRPSRAYSETYDDSMDAIEAFYFLKDAYAWDGLDVGHRPLFKAYAERHKESMRDLRDAAKMFYKHAAFLAQAMQRGDSDGVVWAVTPFFKHLREKFPQHFEPAPKPASKPHSTRSASGTVSNGGGKASRRKPSESAARRAVVIPDNVSTTSSRRRDFTPTGPTPEELEIKAKALWKVMLDTYKKLGADVAPEDFTLDAFAVDLHTWYQFDDVEQASDYLCALAPPMLQHMEKSRGRNWQRTSIHGALQQAHVPAVTRKRALALDLHSRRADEAERIRRRHLGEAVEDSTASEEDDEEESSDEATTPERPKSALRPKSSRFAEKGAKQRGKSYRLSLRGVGGDAQDDEDEDESMPDVTSPTKRKASTAAAVGRPRKRAANEVTEVPDADAESEEHEAEFELPLRRRTDDPSAATGANGTATHRSRRELQSQHGRSTRAHPRPPSPSAVAPLATEPLPSEEANGPGDTWACAEDGCTCRVYGVGKDLGRRLVREHIADHEKRRRRGARHPGSAVVVNAEALALVRHEEEMCNLPVGNLIRRIRELAAGADEVPAFPAPIAQRY